jgi:hypothetical protein
MTHVMHNPLKTTFLSIHSSFYYIFTFFWSWMSKLGLHPRCYDLLINGAKWECNKRNVFKGIGNVFKLTRLTSSTRNTSWQQPCLQRLTLLHHKKLYIKKKNVWTLAWSLFYLYNNDNDSNNKNHCCHWVLSSKPNYTCVSLMLWLSLSRNLNGALLSLGGTITPKCVIVH